MKKLLKKYYNYNNKSNIYGRINLSKVQSKEFSLRKKVAKESFSKDYLKTISQHHSIRVMDREVNNLLLILPKNSIICDIGGSWGWHWRNISKQRPDVKVVIIDFIYENLLIAKKILKNLINKQVFLINDDCCKIKFKNNIFDAVWTVQTLQHVKNYKLIVNIIYKILKKDGYFFNYNLNINTTINLIYKIFKKNYLIKGYNNSFYLERSNQKQKNIIKKKFKKNIDTRYTELLFHPDLKIFTGSENNFIGKIDSYLSGDFFFKKVIARQECFSVKK